MPLDRSVPLLLAIGALAALLALLSFAARGAGNLDDAFILMVYVRNLLEHGVIAWNVADGPIDGCTSLLDLLVKAATVRIAGLSIFQADLRATLASLVAGAWLALGLGWREGASPTGRAWLAAGAGLLLATSAPNAESAAFLLEGPLFVACALAFLWAATPSGAFSQSRLATLVALGWLVVLARPEGLVLAVAVLLATAWRARRTGGARPLAVALACFGAGLLGYFAWRIATFGYWAPNTYYAKTSASRLHEIRDGAAYVLAYTTTWLGALELLPVLIAPAALASRNWRSSEARWRFALFAGGGLGLLSVVVGSGGDIYPGGRFLNLPVSLAGIALVIGAAGTGGALRRGFIGAIAGLCLLQGWHALAAPRASLAYLAGLRESAGVDPCEVSVARRLLRAEVSVGQTDFQRLAFLEPRLRVVDLSGLSDRAIAHQPIAGRVGEGKFTLEAVVARRPEVFVWGYSFWRREPITRWTMREIAGDPVRAAELLGYREARATQGDVRGELQRLYLPASLALCADSHGTFNAFVRRDAAARLARVGFVIGR